MHTWQRYLRVIVALAAGSLVTLLVLPGLGLAAQLLANPGLNDPDTYQDTGRDWYYTAQGRNYDEKVADGWWFYYVPGGTYHGDSGAGRLHWMTAQQFAQAFGGTPYYREPDSSQVVWSSYEMDGGIYQRVGNLQAGRAYAFEVAVESFWRGSSYPQTDGKINKCLGIDPTGGISPTATSVIWDWDNCDATDKTVPYLDIAATAQAPTMTLFIRIQAPDNQSANHTDLDYVFIDDARGALAPTVVLTASVSGGSHVQLSWSAQVPDPDWRLQGVEVQARDDAGGTWQTIQGRTGTAASASLDGQPGHTYTVRARAWQKRPPEENVNYDLPGVWVERQVSLLQTGVFAGLVTNNFGAPVGGAVITLGGVSGSVTSRPDGRFTLQPPAYGQPYSLSVLAGGYRSPLPSRASVPDSASTTPLTLTLKPNNDAVINGDFELSLNGWLRTGQAALVGDNHSGEHGLELFAGAGLTQTVSVSGVNRPTLAFWVRPLALGDGERFEAEIRAGDASQRLTIAGSGDWQPARLTLDLPGPYTGPLTVAFRLIGSTAQLHLDEVSLGSGPFRLYAPLITQMGGTGPSPLPTGCSSSHDFCLKTVHMLTPEENGGNHHVFLSVLDTLGQPLLDAVISDPPTSTFRVTTGEKNEPFFDYGTKLAEITLYNNGTRLKVIEYPTDHPVTSDQTPLLSTNTAEIPPAWLIEAGYCTSEDDCRSKWPLSQGHYSYWVVFQQTPD